MTDRNLQQYFDLLGLKAKDKVTGFEGVISSVAFDLYGCVQFVLLPPVDKEGKPKDGHWFDSNRVDLLGKKPVMVVPELKPLARRAETPGPADKPTAGRR